MTQLRRLVLLGALGLAACAEDDAHPPPVGATGSLGVVSCRDLQSAPLDGHYFLVDGGRAGCLEFAVCPLDSGFADRCGASERPVATCLASSWYFYCEIADAGGSD